MHVFGSTLAAVSLCVSGSYPCPALARAPSVARAAGERVAIPTREALDRLARAALLDVLVAYERNTSIGTATGSVARRVQPGFLIGADGLAITNYSAVHAAERIQVRFADASVCDADVLGADTNLDLAVIRVRAAKVAASGVKEAAASAGATPDATKAPGRNGLGLPGPESADDGDAWTLFRDVDSGQVRVIERTELVLESGGDSSTDASSSTSLHGRRLRASAVQTALGGQPVVDADGKLRGVWRWTAPDGALTSDVTPASSVAALLASCSSGKALMLAERAKRYVPRRAASFPRLEAAAAASGAVDAALDCAARFAQRTLCTPCGGKGTRVSSTDTQTDTPRSTRRKFDEQPDGKIRTTANTDLCKECGGGKLNEKELWNTCRVLASRVAVVPPRDAKMKEVQRAVEAAISTAIAVDRSRFLKHVHAGASQELVPSSLTAGRAVAFVVPGSLLPRQPSTPASGRPVFELRSVFPNRLWLVDPVGHGAIGENSDVLILATVAGYVSTGDDDVVVLERVSIVPVKPAPQEAR